MDQERIAFTDSELLFYGRSRGFPEDPSDSLLDDLPQSALPEGLVKRMEQHPEQTPFVDAVVAAAMAPGRTLRVFAGSESGFLRLRMAQSIAEGPGASYGILIGSGQEESLLQYLAPAEVLEVLCELGAGGELETDAGSAPAMAFDLHPLMQLILLAACDLHLQGRHPDGWFTAAAVGNAFDRSALTGFGALCAPLAEVAEGWILGTVGSDTLEPALEALVDSGALLKQRVDGISLYALTEAYRPLPEQLQAAENRFTLASVDRDGAFQWVYSLRGTAGQWCFYSDSRGGCLIKSGAEGLRQLLTAIVLPGASGSEPKNTPSARFCAACGKPLRAGADFCSACGKPVRKA